MDAGSTYTWFFKETLGRLGIKSERERDFRTIESRFIRRPIGMGVVEYMGERAPTVLVFAEDADVKVLGVHALEGLGLGVDPTTKELKRVEAVLAV